MSLPEPRIGPESRSRSDRAPRHAARTVRYWDHGRGRFIISVLPGGCYVTGDDELISTILGSCISTCVRDVRRGLGGINHFLLPAELAPRALDTRSCLDASLRYGNFAMEYLLNEFYSRGSARKDLEIKLFGGGQVMASATRIGERNLAFAREYLKTEGYVVTRECVGGYSGRKILYDPSSGRALVKRTHSEEEQALLEAEQGYMDSLARGPIEGGLEIF